MQDIEKVFFSSDHHFGHDTSVARPPKKAWGTNTRHQFASVQDMNRGMIDSWNLNVPEDGTVYVLGDFVYNGSSPEKADWMLGMTANVLKNLTGTKHLVVGNHDLPFHDPSMSERYQEAGFKTVIHGKTTVDLAGAAFDLCHFPRWYGPRTRPAHYPEEIKDWDSANWLLHGHSHGQVQLNIPSKMIEIGVDAWSFRPVAASTIISMANAAEHLIDTRTSGRVAPNTYSA